MFFSEFFWEPTLHGPFAASSMPPSGSSPTHFSLNLRPFPLPLPVLPSTPSPLCTHLMRE